MSDNSVRLGHVQLRVRDLDRSRAFYEGLLGLPVRESRRGVVFFGREPGHHQLALHVVGHGAPASPPLGVGLSHIGFEAESPGAWLRQCRSLVDAGLRVSAFDLGVSWSLYVTDPDGHEVEIYCDTRNMPGGRPAWDGHGERLNFVAAAARVAAEEAVLAG